MKLIISDKEKHGVTFIGSEGSVWANRGKSKSDPESLIASSIKDGEIRIPKSDDHYQNFIDCIYSREQPVAPAEVAHRSITLAHLGNIAMKLQQDLDWDPEAEKFPDHEAANLMLSRPMRSPWDKVYAKYRV